MKTGGLAPLLQPDVLSRDEMIGLVVGLHDAANETLGLGVLEEVSQNSRHISIRTPLVGAAGIRILQLGSIYLDQREGE